MVKEGGVVVGAWGGRGREGGGEGKRVLGVPCCLGNFGQNGGMKKKEACFFDINFKG